MFDIAVIGGGINGCGIARDAAGRGLSVVLIEKSDLASGTSSASTKLVHGGLRYLEHYEFSLVRESLIEREILLQMAPHIIWPMRFVLPHHKNLRPRWLIRLGMFLYDHIGGRKILPASRHVRLKRDPAGVPLKNDYRYGFEYSDCWVDDARLVTLNAVDAARRGADIRLRTEVVSASRHQNHWTLTVTDSQTAGQSLIEARTVVNAAGPWVEQVLSNRLGINARSGVRLVKGSHIVVPKLFDHDRAYIFQNADDRIVFAIPYEGEFTLIGTTDVDVDDDGPDSPQISTDEIAYLCKAVSQYFDRPVTPDMVVWTYAGIRPLYDDGEENAQETTRDYVLELNDGDGKAAPVLSVFGGKITTYRHLAEEALSRLSRWLETAGGEWTSGSHLPGGEFAVHEAADLPQRIHAHCSALDPKTCGRLARTYGLTALEFLPQSADAGDLGRYFGGGLYECELHYLMKNEWATDLDDIIWRRTKLGLHLTAGELSTLGEWIKVQRSTQ